MILLLAKLFSIINTVLYFTYLLGQLTKTFILPLFIDASAFPTVKPDTLSNTYEIHHKIPKAITQIVQKDIDNRYF